MHILTIAIICAGLLYLAVGIYCFRLKDKPMYFWAGFRPKNDELKSITRFNRENGYMWIGYAIIYFVTAILSHYENMLFTMLFLIFATTIGIIVLMYIYFRIYARNKK